MHTNDFAYASKHIDCTAFNHDCGRSCKVLDVRPLLFVRLVQTRVNGCGLFQIDFTEFNAQLSNARVQIRAIQILQGRPMVDWKCTSHVIMTIRTIVSIMDSIIGLPELHPHNRKIPQ